MKLTRTIKILLFLGVAVALLAVNYTPPSSSIYPLYPITAGITVKNKVTGQSVVGASVSAYFWGSLTGTGITNSMGVAQVNCPSGQPVEFRVVASGYDALKQTLTLDSSGSATVWLTPGAAGPTYVSVRIYTVTSEGYKVRDVKISGGASVGLTNADAYADILCTTGQIILRLDGSQASMKRTATWDTFTFGSVAASITASSNAVYTVTVPSGAVEEGYHESAGNWWDWLLDYSLVGVVPNWVLVALLLLILIVRR